jgi:hypothetical protein
MSWIDAFFAPSYQTIQIAGTPLPKEEVLNFLSGFTAADNPTNGSTDITGTGGGGGGGWTFVNSTTASHATPARAAQIFFLCNPEGGPYTQGFPTAPSTDDIVAVKDVAATSAITGIYTNAITLTGTSIDVQDKHTMTITGTTYVWGAANGDGGGDVTYYLYNGASWVVIG